MAVLTYCATRPLVFGLGQAAERQKNGFEYTLGSTIPVGAHSYNKMYNSLVSDRCLKRVLRRITSGNLERLWLELISPTLSGVYIPQKQIRLTPCIILITDEHVVVAIPIYIEGATAGQMETVLKACVVGESVGCKGHELRIILDRKAIGFDKS